ncbi:hypothetical protein [Halosegnis marinus]|uniref:hypothetical protein n=1 Tax=Halosegnis marinus TaxID=3034023 RepID=UPI00361F10BA
MLSARSTVPPPSPPDEAAPTSRSATVTITRKPTKLAAPVVAPATDSERGREGAARTEARQATVGPTSAANR